KPILMPDIATLHACVGGGGGVAGVSDSDGRLGGVVCGGLGVEGAFSPTVDPPLVEHATSKSVSKSPSARSFVIGRRPPWNGSGDSLTLPRPTSAAHLASKTSTRKSLWT